MRTSYGIVDSSSVAGQKNPQSGKITGLGHRLPGSLSKHEETSNLKKTGIKTSRATTSIPALNLSHDAIASRAATLWERKGRPAGRDEEIWLEAEKLLAISRADFDKEGGNDELDALFPSQSGSATTSL